MADPEIKLRPIQRWPGRLRDASTRQDPRFSATWTSTAKLLRREVGMLGADIVVVQLAVEESDLRNDGRLRAAAKPAHPGVVVSFEARRLGPLSYATDLYRGTTVWGGHGTRRIEGWHANLRAIALGLEALRKVDRYGIASEGQQYVGWQALGAGTPMGAGGEAPQMTLEDAARYLIGGARAESTFDVEEVIADAELATRLYRSAAKRHHPDAGGDPATWAKLDEARRLLLDG